MVLTIAEGVRELAAIHEEQAAIFELRGKREDADMLRSISAEYVKLVEESVPEWLPASHVAALKGWSRRKTVELLRNEFSPIGLARKNRAGNWELNRSAIDRIPAKGERAGVG